MYYSHFKELYWWGRVNNNEIYNSYIEADMNVLIIMFFVIKCRKGKWYETPDFLSFAWKSEKFHFKISDFDIFFFKFQMLYKKRNWITILISIRIGQADWPFLATWTNSFGMCRKLFVFYRYLYLWLNC